MINQTVEVFGGYLNSGEAYDYANQFVEETILVKVLNGPTGLPVTPLCYFPLTPTILKQLSKKFKKVTKNG